MNRQGKIYVIFTAIAIIAIVVFEYTKPKEINWFPSYTKYHKIPYGTLVFQEQLEHLFSKNSVTTVDRPPYEYLSKNDTISGTYLFINDNVDFDEQELKTLLHWTSKGNSLFIASKRINKKLLDTLQATNSIISTFNNLDNVYNLQLKNKALNHSETYSFDKAEFIYFFSKIDTLNSSVVGVINYKSNDSILIKEQQVNIIKQGFGKGSIILSTFPQAFTNYFMLNAPNHKYTAGLMSYFDASQPIYVDHYYKSGKTYYSSPLHVVLNKKALKWAYYTMLIGVLIYIIFEGKRKQRAIPIIPPLPNKTLEFTRTISNMYYEKKDHKEMAQHKIQHFLNYIRTYLHLNTDIIDTPFLNNLASRSNNTIEATQHLFKTIEHTKNKLSITAEDLKVLSKLIDTFKSNNIWKSKI